jgi:4-coumarate--CoA ligase
LTATSQAITADSYFRLGDIGFEDKDDNMFVMDRMKELIKHKGFQIAPAELYGIIASNPKVKVSSMLW